MSTNVFLIERPRFNPETGLARFTYGLDGRRFIEAVQFPSGSNSAVAGGRSFEKLLGLTAFVLGVSYFKLLAPLVIAAPEIALTGSEKAFVLDVYENGLAEFYARNNLFRFGRLTIEAPIDADTDISPVTLPERALLPIGGGKDSLVSVELLQVSGVAFTPFAVNPKGPILSSVEAIGVPPVYVRRDLDKEMLRLSKEPGYYNGHVPSTAINSMIASLAALLFGHDRIVLSNERSASEGNMQFDGREANHQYSKSVAFERRIASVLSRATGGALGYFSLLRPYSEARIAGLFARETRFDHVFSSCNRNFRLGGNEGPLWCGQCPKCHFVFLIFAPVMDKGRLLSIFGKNLLAQSEHEHSFRELTGLAGQKPWECVGEILEAAACLYRLTDDPDWSEAAVVAALRADLVSQYGRPALEAAWADLNTDAPEHLVPGPLASAVARHAA